MIQLTPEVGADRSWTVQWVSGATMSASPITGWGGGGTQGPVPTGRRQIVASVHLFLDKRMATGTTWLYQI